MCWKLTTFMFLTLLITSCQKSVELIPGMSISESVKVKAKEIFDKATSVRALLFYILLSIWSLNSAVNDTLDVDVGYMPTVDVEVTNSVVNPVPVEVR